MSEVVLANHPLVHWYNRASKRLMDIVLSVIFILGFFWWISLIVAIVTKITLPGPVFFLQKRTGLNGEDFFMYKFRTMVVNEEADRKSATKNDSRVNKWGEILRKTSFDELPQFLNVLIGDMSIVGPRPHMLQHTEEFSAMVENYMERHKVKPGITGWAQVQGARGEIEHQWQIQDRVNKDIWYINHWSIWLDCKILFMTFWHQIKGDEQAY